MKLSIAWLKEILPGMEQHLQSHQDVLALADKLTMLGLEVDQIAKVAKDFHGVVIAKVIACEPHPDADRLRVCRVDIGRGDALQIVCGAPNAREGMLVALATIGADLGDFKIKKSKLRGVESHGMLCSASELGMSEDHDGIIELDAAAPLGVDIREYWQLDDECLEIELTPNRGDCLSLYGLAREIALSYELEAASLPAAAPKLDPSLRCPEIKVLQPDDCMQYHARRLSGIEPRAQSPMWLQQKLQRMGLRSIHPVVDVCNYVMLLMGQPMHGFDLDQVSGAVQVKRAKAKEKLVLLDDSEIELDQECLVIADDQGALALAGVMGGAASAVGDATCDILLESAEFNPVRVCLQARKHRLSTDSSYRFERGIDSLCVRYALDLATALLQEIVGGQASEVVSVVAQEPVAHHISLRQSSIKRHIGIDIDTHEVERIFDGLNFQYERNEAGWQITAPIYRHDITLEIDVIEELVRIYGYDRIPETQERIAANDEVLNDSGHRLYKMKERLATLGYRECINYSFCDAELQQMVSPGVEAIELKHPISDQLSQMRLSLWPPLLRNALYNQNRQMSDLSLYETGACYFRDGDVVLERQKLAMLLTGQEAPKQWGLAVRSVDFFDLKGSLSALLQVCGIEANCEATSHPALHPGQSAKLMWQGRELGVFGALHPSLQRQLDFDRSVFLAELDLEPLLEVRKPSFDLISKFPSVSRDLAFVLNENTTFEQLLSTVRGASGDLLSDVTVFDIYRGVGVEKNEKSIALGLTFQEASRTLVDVEINELIQGIVSEVESQLGAKLRA